jgi:hypothetical protein
VNFSLLQSLCINYTAPAVHYAYGNNNAEMIGGHLKMRRNQNNVIAKHQEIWAKNIKYN